MFMVILFLAAGVSKADTLRVCASCPYPSINHAVRAATEGAVIIVGPGTYAEGKINIDRKISLIGEDFPEIRGNDTSDVFFINADSVLLSGFYIRDGGRSYIKDLSAIKVNEKRGCRIENNRLDNTFFGIYLKSARQCIVSGNLINGEAVNELSSGNAIHLWYCKEITISGNTCRKHRDGIYLEFTDNSTIRDNLSESNVRYGLHFMFSNNDEYLNNTFRHNGSGVAVMFSRFITMKENVFEENWGPASYGLLLKEIFDGEIRENIFRENTFGIYADGSNRIRIHHNDFTRNGWALKILGSCAYDTITANNFEGNTFDVITNSASNTNLYRKNYWSEYTGYDLDRDGVGDVPYRPVKLFSYIITRVPSSIILLRSAFVDLVNLAEKVTPSITPETLVDDQPLMRRAMP